VIVQKVLVRLRDWLVERLRRALVRRRCGAIEEVLMVHGAAHEALHGKVLELKARLDSIATCAGFCGGLVTRDRAHAYDQHGTSNGQPVSRTIYVCGSCRVAFEGRNKVVRGRR